MFVNTGKELIKVCNEKKLKIWEYTLKIEAENKSISEKEVFETMRKALKVMQHSAKIGREKEVKSVSGLIGGDALKLEEYSKKSNTLTGSFMVKAMAMAISTSEVNAAMGKIVASPNSRFSRNIASCSNSCRRKIKQK